VSSSTSGLVELHYDARLDSTEVLYFTVRADSPKASLVAEDVELRWRGRMFYVGEVSRRRDESGAGLVDVIAPALWNRLADRRVVGSLVLFGVTTSAGAEAIISATDWTVLPVDDDVDNATTFYLEAQDVTVLAALRQWAKITGTELEFDTMARTVRFRSSVGTTRGVPFRYGRNVRGIIRRSSPPRATRLYAFGRNGLTITGQTGGFPYVEDYTYYTSTLGLTLSQAKARYRRDLVYVDNSFTAADDLHAAALARLAELAQPTVSYELDVVDLSELTRLDEDEFDVGDYVRVEDTELGFDVSARITRIDRYPLEPHRGTVELEYGWKPYDSNVSDGRDASTMEWVLLENRNENTERRVRNGVTILNRLDVTTIPSAEWVVGYSLVGVGVGTGSVSISAVDTRTGELVHPTATVPVVAGQHFAYGFTLGDRSLDARERSVVIRAASTGSSVGVDISAGGSNLWVLARGAVERAVLLARSQQWNGGLGGGDAALAGGIPFTVPADVYTLRITAVGGAGGAAFGSFRGGYPGLVRASFAVTPGETLYVYPASRGHGFGDSPTSSQGGYPLGGTGGIYTTRGGGGGGVSFVTRVNVSLANAIIAAAGGGGSGARSGVGTVTTGGDGGFYAGLAGTDGSFGTGGGGATQTAPGAGGTGGSGNGEDGDTDGLGAGGDCVAPGETVLGVGAGGGGAGWHGGGGGGGQQAAGGGGSGYVDASTSWDLYTEDAVASRANLPGYVLIEWDDPTPL
jgi:phage minor structural protein